MVLFLSCLRAIDSLQALSACHTEPSGERIYADKAFGMTWLAGIFLGCKDKNNSFMLG